jgi:DNA-binding XRE family transcriptional regulator
MRRKLKTPRIIKIERIDGFKIYCMFNNGESKLIDFNPIFKEWNLKPNDVEYPLTEKKEFQKVKLRNYTLSWDNLTVLLITEEGKEEKFPYEIDPYFLYQKSKAVENKYSFKIGVLIKNARIKAGLTQEQLAMRSGTSRFYISRLENEKTDIELSTFRKIIEAGLGKHLRVLIE